MVRRRSVGSVLLVLLGLAIGLGACTSVPTPLPTVMGTTVPTTLPPQPTSSPPPTPESTVTPSTLGLTFIAQYDPTTQVLTIYGVTPGATIVLAGTPVRPQVAATSAPTLIASEATSPTPSSTRTLGPVSTPAPALPSATTTATITRTAAPIVLTAASLRGKIVFKTDRDGGAFPNTYAYYHMNADGTDVQRLDFQAASALANQLQGLEGYSPDRQRIVLGERRCSSGQTCGLYILDTTLDAKLLNSNDDISRGEWIQKTNSVAKSPAWSPAGNFIAFSANYEAPEGCPRTFNIFKAPPRQNAPLPRLSKVCGGSNTDHPSFSPDGARLTFWSDETGRKLIYSVDVGGDEGFDYRSSNQRIVSDGKANDWDPLWVK